MPFKLISISTSRDNSSLKSFHDNLSEEDNDVWNNYIDNVVSVAASKYNRSERNIELSNDIGHVSSYIFETLEDAQNYLNDVTDSENPYVKAVDDKRKEYLQNNIINYTLKRFIQEIE
jgi:hypothetical protein